MIDKNLCDYIEETILFVQSQFEGRMSQNIEITKINFKAEKSLVRIDKAQLAWRYHRIL